MASLCSLSDLPFFLPFLPWQGPLSPKHHLFFCSWTFYSTSILNHLVSETRTTGKVLGGEGFSKEQDNVRGEHVLEGLKPSCCQERIEANKWHILETTYTAVGQGRLFWCNASLRALPQPNSSPLQSEFKFQGLIYSHSRELCDSFSDTGSQAAVCCWMRQALPRRGLKA